MTWLEFKLAVTALGVKDEDTIFFIDVHMPDKIGGKVEKEQAYLGWQIYNEF